MREKSIRLNRSNRKLYYILNPLKIEARRKVQAALKKGAMLRPMICSQCRQECKPEAHHEDYTIPLDVIWLCRGCHMERHAKAKAQV